MNTVIPQRDLRNHNAQIMDRVAAGESFVVTRNGVPIADVMPHDPTSRPPRFRSAADAAPRTQLSGAAIAAWNADVRRLRVVLDDAPTDPWDRGSTDAS